MGKSSGSGADVIGAARETGEQARWLAREQTQANRPNQINPWGSTQWIQSYPSTGGGGGGQYPGGPSTGAPSLPSSSIGGDMSKELPYNPNFPGNISFDPTNQPTFNGQDATWGGMVRPPEWTQIERLHPDLERALGGQFSQQADRSELAASMMQHVQDTMGTPHDFNQYGDPINYDPAAQRQAAEDAAYGRATARLDPQFAQQAEALEVQLRNKGLRPGDQAYEAEMNRFNRARTDAYEQARLGATAEGRQETGLGMQQNQLANALRSQKIQEDLMARGYTLQEINALMQGQEIQGGSPSMGDNQTIADMLSSLTGGR